VAGGAGLSGLAFMHALMDGKIPPPIALLLNMRRLGSRTHDRTVLTGGPARQEEDRDQVPSSDLRISQGVLAVRARTSRYRGLPSPRRPRAVKGTVVTVNPDAARSLRTACSGQVR
jgi:hypothetical protein